jgi:hypothetical protein
LRWNHSFILDITCLNDPPCSAWIPRWVCDRPSSNKPIAVA